MHGTVIIISMQVALLNGIAMGGGAGVSIPGMFRVAADKTVCSNFECTFVLFFSYLAIGQFFSLTNFLLWKNFFKLFCTP